MDVLSTADNCVLYSDMLQRHVATRFRATESIQGGIIMPPLHCDRHMVTSVPVIEKQLYLKLISRTGGTDDNVSLFRSPADKFIIYCLAPTGEGRVSSYSALSIQSVSLTPLLHKQGSFSDPFFLVLRKIT